MVAHQHALDEIFILQPEQILCRAVPLGQTLLKDIHRAIGEGGQLFPQGL